MFCKTSDAGGMLQFVLYNLSRPGIASPRVVQGADKCDHIRHHDIFYLLELHFVHSKNSRMPDEFVVQATLRCEQCNKPFNKREFSYMMASENAQAELVW